MPSFTRRYLGGEHEAVWNELRALGPVPDALAEDCAAVATETMRRVRRHAERLTAAYLDLGFVPRGTAVPPPPDTDECARLDALAAEIGGLPYAFDACLRVLGAVWLHGDCAALGLWFDDMDRIKDVPVLPDPLDIGSIQLVEMSWEGYDDDGRDGDFFCLFSGDAVAKANFSGGHYTIALPSRVADPVLVGADATLVEYLRTSIAWGGLPGWARAEVRPPAVEGLRTRPDF